MKTAEQIANETDHLDSLANIRAINRIYRDIDDSHLYPINGRFNATERAIRQVRKLAKYNGPFYGLEYCYMLESKINEIVNSQ